MKEYKAPDKVTQKMTRMGAVAENLTTGTAENISGRPADDNFSEQSANKAGEVLDRADSALTRRSSKKAAKKARKTIDQGTDAIKRPSSQLQFSEEEREASELQKAIRKSDKAADKLDAAREAIPKQKKLIRERTFDEALGKGKTRLRFEDLEKPTNGKMKHNPLSRPVQEAGAQIHGKIREVEKENVGVEGGHAVEQFGEKAVGKGTRLAKNGIRHHKLKPYRAAAKAELASVKANANFKYQKAFYDNPQLASNPVSRFWQKQQIKRNYAKEIKDAGKTAKNTGGAVKTVAVKAKAAAQKTTSFVVRHWKGLLIVVAVGLLIFMMLSAVSSFSNLIVGGFNGILSTSYTAEDEDILGVEDDYTALETALRQQIDRIESDYPGYDEYRYNLSEIGHDPFELASYLTARYEDFSRAEIQAALRELFEKQYTLTIVETVEVRYRTETSSWTDDEGVGNGMMIHCGNPISYASIDSNYWSSHFYAIGRLNYN